VNNNQLNCLIGGEAGFGIMSAGKLFALSFLRGGLYVFSSAEHPSLIRGGHNYVQVRAGEKPVYSHSDRINMIVALNQETYDKHIERLTPDGGIIFDETVVTIDKEYLKGKKQKAFSLPFNAISKEIIGTTILRNVVSLGAVFAVCDYPLNLFLDALEKLFSKKGDKIVESNKKAAEAGYNHIKGNYKEDFYYKVRKVSSAPKMLINGNEAVSLGAIRAGCKFLSAYPMSPASSILHFLAGKAQEFDIVVHQVEDEISAVNMAIGAAFAGARSMTCTSGGGFALMVEGLGLAAMTETPIVIIECQRPGPATGLPTRTEQSDLKFVINASQGEFPRIVMAAGNVEECFYFTGEAFNLAEKYQIPVIVLSDAYLANSFESVEKFDQTRIQVERGKLISEEGLNTLDEYHRHEHTDDGVSLRAFPGQKGGIFTTTGNVHCVDGHISENMENRAKMVDKSYKKLAKLEQNIPSPEITGKEDADITIIGWGSTKGPILEAMKILEENGITANYLQFVYLSPFPAERTIEIINKAKITLIVENNKTAQLASLVKEHTGLDIDHKLLRYDGRPLTPEQIFEKVREVV